MTERNPSIEEVTKQTLKPAKAVAKLLGAPITSAIKEQYTATKRYSIFDSLATKFPRSKTLSSIAESLKKKPHF